MFSKSCEYGIKATIYITEQSLQARRVSLKEVAKAINSPVAFTSKILQQLSRNDVVYSTKGPTGGFAVDSTKIETIKLSDIVKAIDGDGIYKGCGLGFIECNEEVPCPVHHHFKSIRDELRDMLENTTLQSLALGVSEGLTFLKT